MQADDAPLVEQLLAEPAARVHQPVEPHSSIRALRGLGKEIWDGMDAQVYVNQERDASDGGDPSGARPSG